MQKNGTTRTLQTVKDADGTVTSRVRRTVLPSGLRVVTEQMAGSRSASIGVWVNVGSRDETPALHGCSHFLEHLLFKGTPERSAMEISVALDAVGGEFNAFTSKEYTVFHARVLDEDLATAVDVLGDMVTASTITAADVEAERDVILDEIAMHDDDPDDVVHNLFAHAGVGRQPARSPDRRHRGLDHRDDARPDPPLLPPPLPPRQHGRRRWRATSTTRPSCARSRRPSAATTSSPATTSPDAAASRPSGRARCRRARSRTVRPLEQVNLVLGVKGLTRTDPRRYALGVLNTALGGGTSSRMFQEVREHRGLAYSVYSFATHHADAGVVGVVGRLPARQVRRRAGDGARRARQGRRRGPHRGGGRAGQGPAQGRTRARPRGLRLADVAHRQGRAGLRRAAHDRRGGRADRGGHPRRRHRARARAVHPARAAGGRRPVEEPDGAVSAWR